MNHKFIIFVMFVLLTLAVPEGVQAAPQDLTTTNLALLNTVKNYNLGPTGMRGWMLSDSSPDPGLLGIQTRGSWQILVVTVGSGTPASGIMASNDVILGLSTGAGTPVTAWTYSATNDVRKSFGWAIGAAEAGDGKLNIKRWRAGVTTDVTIQLQVLGAYSATAPYNCPKSALILSNACNIIATKSFAYYNGGENGYPGSAALALALLASGNTNYLAQVQTYARAIAPANSWMTYTAPVGGGQPNGVGHGMDVWGWGYNGVFLAEYYLLTGDANVLPAINQFTLGLAQGQGRYGTMGHGCSLLDANGNLHGTIPPYGPVNSCGLVANLAIAMGKKAIVASGGSVDAEIPAAMDRAAKFFGYYVQKGGIPYGEHEPGYFHASNGKDSITALMFAMMGDRPVETEYWTRMVTAGYNGREYGHTGQGFSYLWEGMAASMGGTNAAIAYLKEIRWHLDLERRSDGSFIYDGSEQHGGSDTYDYWNTINYYSIDPTASYVLTYALAKQKLFVTGKNSNPTNWLSDIKVTNAIWAGAFDRVVAGYNTNQLVAALSEYDPIVRRQAAASLGANASTSFSMVTNLASSTNALLREAACQTLGYMLNTAALPLLGQRLTDTNIWVRAQAAKALQAFGGAASGQVTTMMMAFTNNATDPNVIVWSDPLQIANGFLSNELFNNVASSTITANTNLLYPVVRVGLKQPDSNPRNTAAAFMLGNLSLANVKALVVDIMECTTSESQADTMWSMYPRADGIATLANNYHVVEAMPVALDMLNTPPGFGWGNTTFIEGGLNALATYGDSARWTLPSLRAFAAAMDPTGSLYTTAVSAIASISSAVTSPAGLTNLFAVANPKVVVTTNAKPFNLSGYSWRTNTVTSINVSTPAHGTLTGTVPSLTYTPVANYVGVDSFTFQVRDSVSNSPPATVSLIVGMPAGTGLKGEYFDNADFTALKFTRTDAQVNFDWGTGSPSNTMAADTFSVRWSGLLLAPETGNYTFSTLNSDGVRLYVNGVQVIDDFVDQTTRWNDGTPIALTAGQKYEVQMDYYENTGSAVAKLKWAGPSLAGTNGVIIGKEWLYDGTGVTNRAAIAYPLNVSMVQNTSLAILLQGAGNNLTFTISNSPTHGTLTGTLPNMTYTPATNYTGLDSFTFYVNNGVSNSAPATVSISIWAGLPVVYSWKNAASGNWSVAGNWTNAGAPAAAGQPFYTLNFNPSGTYSVIQDLSDGFLLNQLNIGGAVTFDSANATTFTTNGNILPQLNQNSGSAVTFNAPIDLAAMTTLGGTGGGSVTINSVISGAGGLTKNNEGTLQIYNAVNSHSGGTVLNNGTVVLGFQVDQAFGTGPVTLNSGCLLAFNRDYLTNSITLSGGTITSGNSFPSTLAGPVTVTGYPTFNIAGGLQITGNLNGPGGLINTTGNGLSITGTNTCTGTTYLTAGTVTYTKSVSLGSNSLSISDGAIANLNYSGTRTINTLTLGGVNQSSGIYGSTTSSAANKDGHFTGAGTVTVLALPGPVVNNGSGATNLSVGIAGLRGTLTNGPADVRLCWGAADGVTNAANWANSILMTNTPTGAFAANISNLIYGVTYYYRSYASNQWGTAWATTTTNFTTLRPTSSLTNASATGITFNSATLNATLACTGAVYNVMAYWNTINGGTNIALWTNSTFIGTWTNMAATNLSYAATGLAPNTTCYFTFRATNALDSLWATNVQSFTTLIPPAPTVDNGNGATNQSVGVAQLRGTLANGPADVRLYWGTTDGGTNKANWANAILLSSTPTGAFASNASNLIYGLTYYYRAYASNQWGAAWSPVKASFTSLKPMGASAGAIPFANMMEVSASEETGGYEVINAFNGNGLLGDGNTHDIYGEWFSSGGAVESQWVKVRFDQAYSLDYLRVWAFAESLELCVTNADVYVLNQASDPGTNAHLSGGPFNTTGWTLVLPKQGFTPTPTPGGNITNTDAHINLGGVMARQLAFKINAAAADLGVAGFSEIQIYRLAPTPITLTNTAATSVTATTARLNSTLASAGAAYDVYACWNTVNAGTNAAQWTNSAYVGSWSDVAVTNLNYIASSLAANTTYYFTFRATNAVETMWASNVQSFTTTTSSVPPMPVLPGSAITVAGGARGFTFATASGFKYRLAYKNALTSATWLPVIAPPNFPLPDGWSAVSTGSPMSLTDTNTVGQPQRFYRVEVQ